MHLMNIQQLYVRLSVSLSLAVDAPNEYSAVVRAAVRESVNFSKMTNQTITQSSVDTTFLQSQFSS